MYTYDLYIYCNDSHITIMYICISLNDYYMYVKATQTALHTIKRLCRATGIYHAMFIAALGTDWGKGARCVVKRTKNCMS